MATQTKLLSSLAKVFPSDEPQTAVLSRLSMLNNERASFQLACKSSNDISAEITVASPLKDRIQIYSVGLVPSSLPKYEDSDDFFLNEGKPGLYPDILYPYTAPIPLKQGEWNAFWFEISPAGKVPGGTYEINVLLNGEPAQSLTVTILDAALPEQELIVTHWFHTDCLMSWYKVEAFSEEYWRIVENFAACAAEHGINFLLTPLFTPPLDTAPGTERPTVQLVDIEKHGWNYSFSFEKLDRWVEMCDRAGIRYFEMSHLFTQWGAKFAPKIMAMEKGSYKRIFGWETKANSRAYISFLTAFATALTEYIDKKGIRERCFFHVSDEPSLKHFYPYRRASRLIQKLFPGFKVIDALSDYKFYQKGLVKTPIPANDHIEPFIGNVPELWTYYCCGQHRNYVSNRFFAMPGQRARILGMQMFRYDVKGFLQWGFNFWYSQYAKSELNPFEVSDAGGAFPSGDAYVTYPGESGTPLVSMRLKMFYDGIQDMMALHLLESKIGREQVIELLENDVDSPITFSDYPHDELWLLEKREQINRAIAQHF